MSSSTYWNFNSNEFITSILRPVCLPINAPITVQSRKCKRKKKTMSFKYWMWLHWWQMLPWDGEPSWARIRVQCSEIFIMTSGCNDTVTDGIMDGLAMTLLTIASLGAGFTEFDDVDAKLVAALLVEAISILLSSPSISIFSCGAVTGILFQRYSIRLEYTE